jgi:hypothetical protein
MTSGIGPEIAAQDSAWPWWQKVTEAAASFQRNEPGRSEDASAALFFVVAVCGSSGQIGAANSARSWIRLCSRREDDLQPTPDTSGSGQSAEFLETGPSVTLQFVALHGL